jgi:hypothetical protein
VTSDHLYDYDYDRLPATSVYTFFGLMMTIRAEEASSSPETDGTDGLALSIEPEITVGLHTSASPLSDEPLQIEDGLPAESAQAGDDEERGNDDDVDDDELTVIVLDNSSASRNDDRHATMAWIEQTGPEMEERRRTVLLGELKRVQRASFIHFVLLCLIPTALLIIVIATVVGDEDACESEATFCELEPRTFVNAFTTRCVCDSIPVERQSP